MTDPNLGIFSRRDFYMWRRRSGFLTLRQTPIRNIIVCF